MPTPTNLLPAEILPAAIAAVRAHELGHASGATTRDLLAALAEQARCYAQAQHEAYLAGEIPSPAGARRESAQVEQVERDWHTAQIERSSS